jgi:trk system potassium uptake protein TrkA
MATDGTPFHAVVVGCGRVGSSLARALTKAGHSVAVIDRREEAFDRFLGGWSGRKVVGTGFDREVLLEAGIERAGAVAAVTSGDNSNIIVARVARETYGVERVVARIYDARRAALYAQLGIPTIATVEWTVREASNLLRPACADAVEWAHPSDAVAVARRLLPAPLVGSTVAEVERRTDLRILAVTRAGTTAALDAGALLQDGDELTLAGSRAAIAGFGRKEQG